MARTDTFNNWATDVADSIREKTGKTDKIPASQFDTEIKSITTNEAPELQDKTIEITENGNQSVTADEGFDGLGNVDITVNIETPEPNLQTKTLNITENGSQHIRPSEGFDGLSYVGLTIDVDPELQDKAVTITENGSQSITADEGFDGLGKVDVIVDIASSTENEPEDIDFSVLSMENISVQNNGSIATYRGWYLYEKINLDSVFSITYNDVPAYNKSNIYLYGIVFYDENDIFVSGIGPNECNNYEEIETCFHINGIVDIPNNAKYMRVAYLTSADGEHIPSVTLVKKNISLQDKSIEITENCNQSITADEGYDGLNKVEVIVNVETPETNLQDKSITVTENGIIKVTADEGYDGLNDVNVVVNVPNTEYVNGIQYVSEFVPGTINGETPPTYINSVNDNRAQYIGFDLKIIPGKEYTFVGNASDCNYAIMQIGQETVDAVLNGESFDNSTFQLASSGWSGNNFKFTAVEGATHIWVSAKRNNGYDFTSSQIQNLIPCYIEGDIKKEVEPEIIILDAKIYSTEEQVVGKWVDNKPLYRKTFINPFSVSGSTITISPVTHGIENIENIFVGAESYFLDGAGNSFSANYNDVSGSTVRRIRTVPSYTSILISIYANILSDGDGKAYLTVYYTKSTDTSTEETLGTVNYSLDEQEVGTDVEGNIIYEKTIAAQPAYSPNGGNKTTNISYDVENATNVRIIDGFWYGGSTRLESDRYFYGLNFINSSSSIQRQFSSTSIVNKAIKFIAGDWITTGKYLQLYVKIRYAKAT